MIDSGEPAGAIVEKKGLKQITDAGAIASIVDEVLAENPNAVADLMAGKKQAAGFIVGQVMRKSKGKANPQVIHKILSGKFEA